MIEIVFISLSGGRDSKISQQLLGNCALHALSFPRLASPRVGQKPKRETALHLVIH